MTITMSHAATAAVKKYMENNSEISEGSVLRIGVLGGGCNGLQYSLHFADFDETTDTKYDFDGLILATDRKFDPHLDGTEIDSIETPQGHSYIIKNPNFENIRSCPGCGCH
ncbi:MAG: iron-sulfur cluster assembly accessory protein [Planctomycetaceae bacterium]|nr:iron-sulfur cluster assembly accessory protein [Planctomycetaceae bacterium]